MKSIQTNDLAGVYCTPLNLNDRVQHPNSGDHLFVKSVWLREEADPSIAIFNGVYYLFSLISDCYVVGYGIAAHKRYRTNPIYDRCEHVCRSLNVGVPCHFTVNAFNANGYARSTETMGHG